MIDFNIKHLYKNHKKEFLITLLFIVIFLFIYILFNSSALNIYYGNKNYLENNLGRANDYYEKELDDSYYGFIAENNIGNVMYDQENYTSSVSHYEKSAQNCTEECQVAYYNLGNSYYRKGQKLESEEKISQYKKAISSYEKSIEIKDDQDTRENLEFVKKQLETEEQKAGEQKTEDGSQKTEDESSEEKQQGGESDSQDSEGANSEKNNSGSEEGQSGEDGQGEGDQQNGLDETAQQEIQKYMDQLEQTEKDAQQYYQRNPNNGEPKNDMDRFFEDFLGRNNPFTNDPFFNRQLNQNPNSNTTEKDW